MTKAENKIKNAREAIEYPREGILSKVLLKTKKNEVTLFCIAKGSEMPEHTSIRQAFVYVLEGKGTFNLEGQDIKMEPGAFILMKENATHSLGAEENTSFLLSLC